MFIFFLSVQNSFLGRNGHCLILLHNAFGLVRKAEYMPDDYAKRKYIWERACLLDAAGVLPKLHDIRLENKAGWKLRYVPQASRLPCSNAEYHQQVV